MDTDNAADTALRPCDWSEFVGQDRLKKLLDINIEGSRKLGAALGHTLLYGPPGAGKTSLAGLIAARLGDQFRAERCPIKSSELYGLLRRWDGGVLFLDEIHAASKSQQEDLHLLLEDGVFTMGLRRLDIPFITVIAATTEPENVIKPLWDRFDQYEFEDYSHEEMALIVSELCDKVALAPDDEFCDVLGRATAGVPRIARKLVKLAQKMAAVNGQLPEPLDVLAAQGIDEDGLTRQHRRYLEVLDRTGGIAGLETLGNHMRLSEKVLRDLERLLVKFDLISYDARGRVLEPAGARKIKPATRRGDTLAR